MWQKIDSAPKGGGAELVTDPLWVDPPRILIRDEDGMVSVAYWDWFYAESGRGFNGHPAWIEPVSAEQLFLYYGAPTHWMHIPEFTE